MSVSNFLQSEYRLGRYSVARILVVEDSNDVQELLCLALADEGHAAHGVETVAQGSRALEGGNYELLIADMRLPDGSGAELADRALTRGVEALLTTGHPEEMQLLERRGIDYLRKPFPLKYMMRLVDRLVAKGRLKRARAAASRLLQPRRRDNSGSVKRAP
jgi:DNA-binding NtrC family response regulator